jgi:hypothetical protein
MQIWEVPLVFVWLLVFAWILRHHSFFRLKELRKNSLLYFFLLKIIAGTFLWAVYTFHYTDRANADIYKYFDDSKIMTDALYEKPLDYFSMLTGIGNDNTYFSENYYNHMNNWYRKYESNLYNDAHTIIRINAVIRIFSFGSYHVHTLFACFFSLFGLVALYKAFRKFFKHREKELALALFLMPSVVFWSSGVLKEAWLIFGLGCLVYGVFSIIEKRRTIGVFIMVMMGIVLLLYLKVYVLMALIPGGLGYLWVHYTGPGKWWWKYPASFMICALLWVYFEYLFPHYHMLEILVQKREDFIRLSEFMQSGSMLYTPDLQPNFLSFLQAAPIALANVLCRPFIGESFSPVVLMASLENLLLLAGIFFAVVRRRKLHFEQKNLLIFALGFVVLLFVIIGWVTPVMGAIVRYKVPALPFLGMLIVLVADVKLPSLLRDRI